MRGEAQQDATTQRSRRSPASRAAEYERLAPRAAARSATGDRSRAGSSARELRGITLELGRRTSAARVRTRSPNRRRREPAPRSRASSGHRRERTRADTPPQPAARRRSAVMRDAFEVDAGRKRRLGYRPRLTVGSTDSVRGSPRRSWQSRPALRLDCSGSCCALLGGVTALAPSASHGEPRRAAAGGTFGARRCGTSRAHTCGCTWRRRARYGLDWAILAAIGKVECDHGRDPDPSCRLEGRTNSAGAGGPMQFLASTWAAFGVDGDGDGRADRWDAADAVFAAANYLRASGAPGDDRRAIFAYNHAQWYVDHVEHWAARYRARPRRSDALAEPANRRIDDRPAPFRPASSPANSRCSRRATAARAGAAGVPAVVQAMVVAGNELQHLPYGPDGHPDPRGAGRRGLLEHGQLRALSRGRASDRGDPALTIPLAQDYVHWGAPGPGRWVTIYATATPTPHVFVVIAGLRLDTSHNGTDVGPNRDEDGPRWRILDHIPTWAHWSVRHPPGCKVARDARAQGRVPADRRRPRLRELRSLAARGGRRRRDPARGPRARPALQPPGVLEGLPARRGGARGAYFRPDEWWEEQRIELLTRTSVTALDLAGAHGQALDQGGGRLRARR